MYRGLMAVKKVIEEHRLRAEILEFEVSTDTVLSAALAVSVDCNSILKTVLAVGDGQLIACLVCGLKRVDFEKVRRLVGVKKVRMMRPDEIERYTPFKVGGVSPLFPEIANFKVLMDKGCFNVNEVILGGGDEFHLVRISVDELLKFIKPVVADITV